MELPRLAQVKILSLLPLKEFQTLYKDESEKDLGHQCTYAERYLTRYGTKFPRIRMTTFETREDQYLFCAAWFHDEVGWKSHLFYPIERCLKKAIIEKDLELIKYFRLRYSPYHLKNLLKEIIQIVETGDLKIIKTFDLPPSKSMIHFERKGIIKIPNSKVADLLLKHYQADFLCHIYRDLPLEYLDTLEYSRQDYLNEDKIKIIYGLVSSGDPINIERGREIIAEYVDNPEILSTLDEEYRVGLFRCIAILDDTSLFEEYWRNFENNNSWRNVRRIFDISVCVGVNCLKWIYSEEGAEFFSNLKEDRLCMEECEIYLSHRFSVNSKRKEILDLLVIYLENWRLSSIFANLAVMAGDERLLEINLKHLNSTYLARSTYWDLICRCLLKIEKQKKRQRIKIPFTTETFQLYLKYRFNFTWFRFVSTFGDEEDEETEQDEENPPSSAEIEIDYPTWERLVSEILKTNTSTDQMKVLASSAPTHFLSSVLLNKMNFVESVTLPQFITYPISVSNLRNAIESNNFEFLSYALSSELTHWHYEFRFDTLPDNMINFLNEHLIKFSLRKSYMTDMDRIKKDAKREGMWERVFIFRTVIERKKEEVKRFEREYNKMIEIDDERQQEESEDE